MITVHHLENSRSLRILWLLEELNLEYEIQHYARNKKTMLAPPELKQVHPLGKSPVIVDSDGKREYVIAETGAIIEYVIERYGKGQLSPELGSEQRIRYLHWLHYAEGSMMPLLVMKLIFLRLSKPPMPLPLRPVAKLIATGVMKQFLEPRITTCLQYMQDELQQSSWFAGDDFTAADIMLSFPLQAAAARSRMDSYPELQQFLEDIQTRPAYQRALQRGGSYTLSS